MSPGKQRLKVGSAFCEKIWGWGKDRRWTPSNCGMEHVFPPIIVAALQADPDCDLRWIPDMIMTRGTDKLFIDGKATIRPPEKTDHFVELASVMTLWKYSHFGIPVYLVFDNATYVDVRDVYDRMKNEIYEVVYPEQDERQCDGSKTPYVIIPKVGLPHIDELLGKPLRAVPQGEPW
jgi:hypothetical protein